jgi:RNA polymerase sigma factor (sigma-70 family)
MAAARLSLILDRLRSAALVRQAAERSDGQLLEAYIADREEAAFEALVRRHGPMVLGVCRRLLGHEQDAEDAFQATFLVLVRKAASIRPRHKVGSWLYGVAYHAAQKARAAALRRAMRERQVRTMPEPATVAEGLWHDLVPLLDAELSRLPERYRLPLVLCDLEGQTRKEAARQLGWPEGTVAGRLAGGRALLARRLGRHGVPVSAGVLAAVLAQGEAVAAVPLPLVRATVRAARMLAAGGAASAPAAALMEGVVKAMLLTKLKIVTALVLALAVAGAGVGIVTHRAGADEKTPPAAQKVGPKEAARADTLTLKNLVVDTINAARSTIGVAGPKRPVAVKIRFPSELKLKVEGQAKPLVLKLNGPLDGVAVVQPGQNQMKLAGLPVARDARITIKGAAGKLADLKVGMRVSLELGTAEGQLVVRRIEAEP